MFNWDDIILSRYYVNKIIKLKFRFIFELRFKLRINPMQSHLSYFNIPKERNLIFIINEHVSVLSNSYQVIVTTIILDSSVIDSFYIDNL